jgi:hypothetical protein
MVGIDGRHHLPITRESVPYRRIHIAGTRDLLGLGWKDPLYDCSGIACPVLLFSASGMEGVPGLD